ncbi:MAG: hypothetical protein P8X91_06835 [Candidatus Bathyarchaeota archaeon]|jgi:hypothetical protein
MDQTIERVGYLKLRPNLFHLVVGIILMICTLIFHVLWIGKLDNPSMVALAFFNLLFVFLLFPIDGSLLQKFILLISGNLVGTLWYILQKFLEQAFLFTEIEILRIILLLFKPLIDFMWLVVFWSFSLSIISSTKRKTQRRKRN